MELKFQRRALLPMVLFVLIVPLWNWNKVDSRTSIFIGGSNCTFMELKSLCRIKECSWLFVLIVPLWNWNSKKKIHKYLFQKVLIVPLWNWNIGLTNADATLSSSNCTFMELKFYNSSDSVNPLKCSNCTFMELKSSKSSNLLRSRTVLIVPLWNWNPVYEEVQHEVTSVLIVPLWNWNIRLIKWTIKSCKF